MENTTTRLAVLISKLSDFEFSWEDSAPQGYRKKLTEDLLANKEDGLILYERMVKYVYSFIATEFDDLCDLRPFIDDPNSGPRVQPSVVLPMKILFHDEKYTSENILILQRLAKDAKMSGTP